VNLDGVIPVGEVRRRKSTEDAEPVSDCCKKSVRLREFRGAPDPGPSAPERREFVDTEVREFSNFLSRIYLQEIPLTWASDSSWAFLHSSRFRLFRGGPYRPVPVFVSFSRFGAVELAGVGTAATVFSHLLIRQH